MNYLGDALQELDEDLDDDSELSTDSEEDMFYRSVKCKIELGYVLCHLRTKFWHYGLLLEQVPGGGFMRDKLS